MGGVGLVLCNGFLVGEACACVLVDGVGSHLSEGQVQCPVVGFEVSVGLVRLWATCLLVCSTVTLFC